MDRDTALSLALALLALLSLGLAAATLDDPAAADGQGTGFGGTGGAGDSEEGSSGAGDEPGGVVGRPLFAGELPVVCFPWLQDPFAILAGLLVLAGVVGLARYDTGSWLPGIVLAVAFGGPFGILWYLLSICEPASFERLGLSPTSPENATSILPSGGAGGSSGTGSDAALSAPSIALALVLGVAIAGAVLLLLVGTGDDREAAPDAADAEPESVDVVALGAAAGAAADRIEADADASNEVYRAWVEMTGHLDVPHPRSSTPGEFAEAAVEAGMARDDVAELTGLFEEVRYGEAEITPERERRAVEALRRVEEAYGE